MILKILQRIQGLLSVDKTPKSTIIPRSKHNISRKDISPNALKVLYRLHQKGYQAYLVGGGIRDLLLGLYPKDFDVATNATPEQVRAIFRNCRLIGRRFRLAHVFFGPETIEVATFRKETLVSSQGKTQLIVQDNDYGDLTEDAFRRDFTINALYYNIDDFSLVDYHQGLKDIQDKTLRMIGDPEVRYTEDPVRMLRAIRLAAKCGLTLEKQTQKAIDVIAPQIHQVAPSRLYEEILKLFLTGYGVDVLTRLLNSELFEQIFPDVFSSFKQSAWSKQFLMIALANTDARVAQKKAVIPAFFFACLLWAPIQKALASSNKGLPPLKDFIVAMEQVIDNQSKILPIPKKVIMNIQEIYFCYYRMSALRKKQIYRLVTHPKFRAGLDFLELVASVDKEKAITLTWWQEFLAASEYEQSVLLAKLEQPPKRKKRKKTGKTDSQSN
jgi:poly(A) polymerase